VFHVAISCPLAVHVRREVKNLTGCKLPQLHRDSWATDLLSGKFCSFEETIVFICGAWSMWSGRNARRHGRASKHVATLIEEMICLNHNEPRGGTGVRQNGLG
jgi:hypothetical protein